MVVLHLVCVSTNLRSKETTENRSFLFWGETEATPQVQTLHTADSVTRQNAAIHNVKQLEPYWLQDSLDQQCLGPMGRFSECGDANLWRMIPKSMRHARRRKWIQWALEADDDDQGDLQGYYALQIFEQEISEFYGSLNGRVSEGKASGTSPAGHSEDYFNKECITRRRKDNKLVVVPCSEDRAWYWRVNEYGVLHFDKPARGFGTSGRRTSSGSTKRLLNKRQNLDSCVWRKDGSEAFLSPCDGDKASISVENRAPSSSLDWNGEGRVAQMQFVRHSFQRDPHMIQSTLSASSEILQNSKPLLVPRKQRNKDDDAFSRRAGTSSLSSSSSTSTTNLPSRVDIAHSHASVPSGRSEPRYSTIQSKPSLQHRHSETNSTQIPQFLGNTNPILLATGPKLTPASGKKGPTSSTKDNSATSSIGSSNKLMTKTSTITSSNEKNSLRPLIHTNDNLSPTLSVQPIVRKIQTNPYVAASKDERWVDPQTGLIYPTDLCQYLGHTKKDVGRHTLTGVGQYTKTMLNIKVYGVGLYVSKRDILADPSFEPYATLSSQALRERGDLFRVLRTMKGFTSTNEPAGQFDRTIFLKINMQLTTATMRSSLDADWKMLTPESKELLIGSSMKPRPADPIFLEIAKSPDNPNRCTCAQIAPPEYNADPSCCARGTELVFTWRKNGDLEVRLNGVFMDSFPRPDIAEGIFFEYLRLDDPMSWDFLDRVVDGFPSLLAPLSQVRGVATPIAMQQTNIPTQVGHGGNPIFRMIGGVGGAISSQAATFADFIQSGTQELAGSAMDKARSVGSTARNIGEEVERRRDLIGKHVSAFTNQALSSLVPSNQKSLSVQYPGWIPDIELENLPDDLFAQNAMAGSSRQSSFKRTISRIIGLEDDSMSASNITQKLFFGLVHLYLLLLLIASFPAQWTTRTKIVASRKEDSSSPNAAVPTDSENSDSDDSIDSFVAEKENKLKKRLDYDL